MPFNVEKLLGFSPMREEREDGHVVRIQRRFKWLVNAEVDVPIKLEDLPLGKGSIAAAFQRQADRQERKRAAASVHTTATAAAADEDDPMDEGEGEEADADEGEEIEVEPAPLDDDEEEEPSVEEGDVDDDASVCRSAAAGFVRDAQLEEGQLRITSTRFHRFSLKVGKHPETRFAAPSKPTSFINPAGIPSTADALKAEPVKINQNRDTAVKLRITSGFAALSPLPPFAQTEETPEDPELLRRNQGLYIESDMAPLYGLHTDLPFLPFTASKKTNDYNLVETESFLELNLNPILQPTTFLGFRAYKPAYKGFHKWFAKVLAKRNETRQENRVVSIAEGEKERSSLQEEHDKYLSAYEFACFLKRAASQTESLRTLSPGSYNIVALWQRTDAHVLYLQEEGRAPLRTCLSLKPLDDALKRQTHLTERFKHDIKSSDGDPVGVFFIEPGVISTASRIGKLNRTTAGQHIHPVIARKRKHGVDPQLVSEDGVGRPDPKKIGFSVTIDDTLIYISDAQKKANEEATKAAVRAAQAATTAGSEPVPVLPTHGINVKNLKGFCEVFYDGDNDKAPVDLAVLACCEIKLPRRKNTTVLKVKEVGKADETAVVVWAPHVGFDGVVDRLFNGCILHVARVLKKNKVEGVTVSNAAPAFVPPKRQGYNDLPFLHKGRPEGVHIVTFAHVAASEDKNGDPRAVVKDTDGKVWRIKDKRFESKLKDQDALQPGYGVNVPAWMVVEPTQPPQAGPPDADMADDGGAADDADAEMCDAGSDSN